MSRRLGCAGRFHRSGMRQMGLERLTATQVCPHVMTTRARRSYEKFALELAREIGTFGCSDQRQPSNRNAPAVELSIGELSFVYDHRPSGPVGFGLNRVARGVVKHDYGEAC